MPHCTTDFAHYLGKFIVGLTGMLYLYITLLKQEERIREQFELNSRNNSMRMTSLKVLIHSTNSCTLGGPKNTGTSWGCRERCIPADAQDGHDLYMTVGQWLWSQIRNIRTIATEISLPVGPDTPDNFNEPLFSHCNCCSRASISNRMSVNSISCLRRSGRRRRSRNCLCRRPKCFEKSAKRKRRKYSSINIHVSHGSICHSCSVCSRRDETISNDRTKINVADNSGEIQESEKEVKGINDNGEFHIKVKEEPHLDNAGESNVPLNEIKVHNGTDKKTLDAATSFQQLEIPPTSPIDRDSKVYDREINEPVKYEKDFTLPYMLRSPSLNNYLASESSESSVTKSSSESSLNKRNEHHGKMLNSGRNKMNRQPYKSHNNDGIVNKSYANSETESTDDSKRTRNFSSRTPQIPNRYKSANPVEKSQKSRSINPNMSFDRNSSMQSRRSVHFHPQVTDPYEYSGVHRIPYQGTPKYGVPTLRQQSQVPYEFSRNNSQLKSNVYPRPTNTSTYAYNYAHPRISRNINQQSRQQVPVEDQYNYPRSMFYENSYKYRQWNGRTPVSKSPYMPTIISSGQSRSWAAIGEREPSNLGLTHSSHTLVVRRSERRLPSVEDLGSDDSLPEYASETYDVDSDTEQESSEDMEDIRASKRKQSQKQFESFMHSSMKSEGSKAIMRNRREFSWHANENSNRSNMHRPWSRRIWEEVTYVKK